VDFILYLLSQIENDLKEDVLSSDQVPEEANSKIRELRTAMMNFYKSGVEYHKTYKVSFVVSEANVRANWITWKKEKTTLCLM
jgi:hypothetical protein